MRNNKIQNIKNFLEQYRRMDIYWKELLKESYEYYEKKLLQEYRIYGIHPYPDEYNNYQNNINNYNNVWLVL